MTKEELREVASLSGSLISLKLNDNRYETMDNFLSWMFNPLLPKTANDSETLNGELASFGNNSIDALSNLVTIYYRHYAKSK